MRRYDAAHKRPRLRHRALDVLSTLLRQGHSQPILAISRHGVRPRAPRHRLGEAPVATLLAKIDGEVPDYVRRAVSRQSIRALSRALRDRIRETAAEGVDWQMPFDDVRNVVWQFWPTLPLEEKRRFLRHLRVIYEAHRFRAPPQNDLLLREGERPGHVLFRRGRVDEATAGFQNQRDVARRVAASDDRRLRSRRQLHRSRSDVRRRRQSVPHGSDAARYFARSLARRRVSPEASRQRLAQQASERRAFHVTSRRTRGSMPQAVAHGAQPADLPVDLMGLVGQQPPIDPRRSAAR